MFSKTMKCKTCGAEISKKAKQCPQCGHSYEKNSSGGGMSILTFLIILVFIAIAIPKTSTTSSNTTYAATSTTNVSKTSINTQQKQKSSQKKPQKTEKEEIKERLETVIAEQKKSMRFNKYKTLNADGLNERLQKMRHLGKVVFFAEDKAKKDKDLKKLWQTAYRQQIKFQTTHYPRMRDAFGPVMRKKLWEHNMEVKTVGKGFRRVIFTAAAFANNARIKQFHEGIGVMLSDYRFKRVDYKWIKHAHEWTYFDLQTKPDNKL